MLLIYILILVFICLLVYQTYLAISPFSIIEGLENTNTNTDTNTNTNTNTNTDTNSLKEYKPYNLNDPNNALILAQQNAGNIEVLKGRIDTLDGVNKRVDNLEQSVELMQTQLDGLVQQQANFAQDIAGSTPPEITGTDAETTENVELSIEDEDK